MNFKDLQGMIIDSIETNDKQVVFKCGLKTYVLEHIQIGLEKVQFKEAIGELNDLYHVPILFAEKACQTTSHTDKVTVFFLATSKGFVTFLWFGKMDPENTLFDDENMDVTFAKV